MISAGNDVVSLNDIDAIRTQKPAFYSKILSATEINLYKQVYIDIIPLHVYVWLLWSVKESAYKYLQRLQSQLIFSPTKFVVTQLNIPLKITDKPFNEIQHAQVGFHNVPVYTAQVRYGPDALYSNSAVYSNMLHTVVNSTPNFEQVSWGIHTIQNFSPMQQSVAVRAFLSNTLQTIYPDQKLQMSKSPHGCPFVWSKSSNMQLPVSLSHHGQFVAYSF